MILPIVLVVLVPVIFAAYLWLDAHIDDDWWFWR